MSSRLQRLMRPTQEDYIPPELKIKYFPAAINIGGFTINTNPTGAIEVKPQAASPEQAPSQIAKPVSIAQDVSGLYLIDTAETGGRIPFTQLINALIDLPNILSVNGVEMSLRSAFGRLFTRLAATEANVADISGVRLAAEEAKSALNDIHDAMQDVSGALIQLRVATAQSDLSGVLVRVQALESAPGFDATAINATIADLSGNLNYYKTTNNSAVSAAQSAADAAQSAADAAQSAADAAQSAADLAQSTADTKVDQSTYNAFVIDTNSALDSKALASDLVSGLAAKADASALADKEDKGLVHKLVVEDISTAGISGAYWGETIGATIAASLDLGKIVNYIYDAPASPITLPVGTPSEGAVRRLRNGHESGVLSIVLGESSYEIVAGETMVFQFNGSVWRLV